MKIAVYCSAREAALTDELIELGQGVGSLIASVGDLVYGGGNRGMMRVIASSVAAYNGRIHGIITHHLANIEGISVHVTDLSIVESMSERKNIMRNMADMAIVLPGGAGTMDELFDFLVHNQLNQHLGGASKPVFIYGGGSFGTAVRGLLDELILSGMIASYDEINVQIFEDLSYLEEVFDLGPVYPESNVNLLKPDVFETSLAHYLFMADACSQGTSGEAPAIDMSSMSDEEMVAFFNKYQIDTVDNFIYTDVEEEEPDRG